MNDLDIQIAIDLLRLRILVSALNESFMSDDTSLHIALHRAADGQEVQS